MTSPSVALTDSGTMLRRNLRHMLRYPSLPLFMAGVPIVFLLLFVYVFGGTLGNGLAGPLPVGAGGGRSAYVAFVAPGIILITIAGAGQMTAISIATDMTEGIVARFRAMAIARGSVLTGHVVGSMIQVMISLAIVIGVALGVGFRPNASPLEWLAAIGFMMMITFALTWLSVALGMVPKTVGGASNLPMPLQLLPLLGSGFVPTDSMPAGLRAFAAHQPFTPFIDTVRGLLTGTHIGDAAAVSAVWCAGIALVGYVWARSLFGADPSRR
jgi:ABC-2 type transport system permease protein